jgi:NADH-quinone oxidoreductase subunit J
MRAPSFFYEIHFYLFGVIAIAAAIAFITRKSPVAAALWLVVTMFCLSAMYVLLDAQFIGAIQVLVYAGAIMVVFLFVIMLLNLGHPSQIADLRRWPWWIAGFAAGALLLADLYAATRASPVADLVKDRTILDAQLQASGAVGSIAQPLFAADGYLLAFELTSVLLLVAIIGAVILGKRRDTRVS